MAIKEGHFPKLNNSLVEKEASKKDSFWDKEDSVEKKVQKVEELFNNLDITELQKEDEETHLRGWNTTNNIEEIESFKKSVIGLLSGKEHYSLHNTPCFEKLIKQKSYQDIVWVACELDPEIFNRQQSSLRLNAFVQERPEFLDSQEFRGVCLEYIKDGIENKKIFEGYKSDKDPKNIQDFKNRINKNKKIDYFEEKEETSWDGKKNKNSDKEIETKTKRTSIPNSEVEELIVNPDIFRFDASRIDNLKTEEKEELKSVFLKEIKSSYTYCYSEKIFGDEIISVGKKIGFSEKELNDLVFHSILKAISNGMPPRNEIEKEFPEVYKRIQETLSNPEKRQDYFKIVCAKIGSENQSFRYWEESIKYLNLSEEELSQARNSYLDFSSLEKYSDSKTNNIFGYSWSKEEDLDFTKEEMLKAFGTMSPGQKADIIHIYSKGDRKLDSLPFEKKDILQFASDYLNLPDRISPYHVEQAQKNLKYLKELFPDVSIDDADIVKENTFQKLKKINEITTVLQENSVEMTPQEIVDRFGSPENFVLKQIKGAELVNLKALENFKNNPDSPELPNLPDELFNEIKKALLENLDDVKHFKKRLSKLIYFIPKKYNFELLTNPELQNSFSERYYYALEANDKQGAWEAGSLVSNSERLKEAEEKLFKKYLEDKDYYNLIKYYEILASGKASSPVIKKIEEFFKGKLDDYGVDNKKIILNYNTLKETLEKTSQEKLEELNPDNLSNDEFVKDWFNIKYGKNSDIFLQSYNLIKSSKDFSYFSKEIRDCLNDGSRSDKFVEILKSLPENNPASVEFAVTFHNDTSNLVDAKKYIYFYQFFSKLNPEEYTKQMDFFKKFVSVSGFNSVVLDNEKKESFFPEVCSYNKQEQDDLFNLIGVNGYINSKKEDLNWAQNTIVYINEFEDLGIYPRNENRKKEMENIFSGDYKDVALSEMTAEWQCFLKSDLNVFLPRILLVSKAVDSAGGAGNLKYIESLSALVSQFRKNLKDKKTSDATIKEVKEMMSVMESRFSKEGWLQDNISEFYNISKDILEAAPSLYASFKPVFENLSAKDIKKFMSEVFPFYQAELLIKQNIDDDNTSYNSRELVGIRKYTKDFSEKITDSQTDKKDVFQSEKLRLLEIVRGGFKDRFGLLKVPDNFTKENLRSIQNTIRYIGNINERSPERESLISLYLGLVIDNKWSAFRGGKEIDFSEYITEEKLELIKPSLEKKQDGYKLLSEVTGLSADEMSKFQDLLQEDISTNFIGSMQTIDVKLGNIKRNIDELVDPDVYTTQKDKNILKLFSEEGKNVNTVLSKIYGVSTGKNIQLSEEDLFVRQKIESIFGVTNLTPDKIKEIQDEVQPIGMVINIVNKMNDGKVEENILELQKRLTPSNEIIEIFNKLGEEFHQESGAIALSKDLSYLESLIVKNDDKINPEERELVRNYIESINEKMKEMELVFNDVKQYIEKINKASHTKNNPILENRIKEIKEAADFSDSVITSHMTQDLNLIIENMRQCLGCMRKEQNNDTNLAFGDYNKFFMMNRSDKDKGSVADEIVFFIPITLPDGSREMSFVMDKVYGTQSSDMLLSNIASVYKKYLAIKKEFSDVKLSVSVTEAAMSSTGIGGELLKQKLEDLLGKKSKIEILKGMNAFVPKSSLSDNYVEFSGGARLSGDREFSGLIVK